MGSIDVGDKVKLELRVAIGLQSLGHHDRTEVRATNTNVDDRLDPLASVTLPFTAPDLLGELLHVLEHRVDFLDDALAVHLHGLVGDIAQSNVVDGTVLGEVDGVPTEHVIAKLLQVSLLGQLDQEAQSVFGEEVLGEVKEDLGVVNGVDESAGELLEALGVLLEVFLEDNVASQGVVMILELLPSIQLGSLRKTGHDEGLLWSGRFVKDVKDAKEDMKEMMGNKEGEQGEREKTGEKVGERGKSKPK